MLKGVLKYHDFKSDKYNGDDKVYNFDVKCAEFPGTLWLNLTSTETDPIRGSDVIQMIHRQVKNTKDTKSTDDYINRVTPTCRIDISSNVRTNAINVVFAARVGSAVGYALDLPSRVVTSDDGAMVSEEKWGSNEFLIKYFCSVPREVYIKTKYIELTLEKTDEIEVFPRLQVKNKYGNIVSQTPVSTFAVQRNIDTLGFEPKKKEVDDVPDWGLRQTIEEVIEANPQKNTSWILDRHYVIVHNDSLDSVLQEFMDYDGLIAFDTETTGLNITFRSQQGCGDTIVGFSLSYKEGEGYYFPLAHKKFDNLTDDITYFMQTKIKPILEGKQIICHNTSFDWKVAYLYGLNTNVVFDTMIAFNCTFRYQYGITYETGLKALAKNILGLDMFELSDFVIGEWGSTDINFSDLPYELVRRYAPTDADMTLALYNWLKFNNVLEKYNAQRVHDLEVQFAKVVGYSELWGYHVDMKRLPDMVEKNTKQLEEAKAEMFRIVGHEFNPNSPVQLKKIMYEELGIEKIGGQDSTKAEILKELAKMQNPDGTPKYPFVTTLLDYRNKEGTNKNFIKKREEFITPDGFIFPHVFQFGTDTGRVSIKEPNYQSYDKLVKHYIVPREGYIHFDCDYSQIEYRVLASMAQQTNLCEAFADADMDYHTYQAARMFNVPYASVTSELRKQSKGINFGLPYGMQDRSLGKRIFGQATPENTAKAAQLRKKYFQGQEKIQQFFDVVRSKGVADGYTETWLGRRRYYDKQRFDTESIRRQAGNHAIQGSAADIFKIGVVSMFDMMVRNGWLGKVLINCFVHDEILMEIHSSINPYEFLKYWREEYQVKIKGFCQLYAGAGFGRNWYEAKSQDLPPQFIQECIDKADTMAWDGNIDKFLKQCSADYFDYKVRRVVGYITDPDNDNKIIKPLINALLLETLSEKTGVSEKELLKEHRSLDELILKFKDVFSTYFNSEMTVYKVLSPDTVVSNKTEAISVDIKPIDSRQSLISRCLEYGVAVDVDTMTIYVLFINNKKVISAVQSLCNKDTGYRLHFVVKKGGKNIDIIRTESYVKGSDALSLQTMFKGMVK